MFKKTAQLARDGFPKGCVTIQPLEDENSYDSDISGDGDLSEGESGEDNQDVEEV